MFEFGPFKTCPSCKRRDTFGILSAGGDTLIRRCKDCRHATKEPLPYVSKSVVYLDQSAISNMFKVDTRAMSASAPHKAFWEELRATVRRVLYLQQAIFPHSNIHLDETIVSHFAKELRAAYEMLSGDVTLLDDEQVKLNQLWTFADAYLSDAKPPDLLLNVDEVLSGTRNAWLRDIHITVNADYSQFADSIRKARDSLADEMRNVSKHWAAEKPSFDEALRAELTSFGPSHKRALVSAVLQAMHSMITGDSAGMLEGSMNQAHVLLMQLKVKFREAGVQEAQVEEEVLRFWDWPGLEYLPVHRISAHMYAALARKIAAGQQRPPSRGMMNDVRAVSAYAPYMDAMFLDNECAALLSEEPLRSDLRYRARIFSLNTRDQFLEWLCQLARQAAPDVRAYAEEIYGLKG